MALTSGAFLGPVPAGRESRTTLTMMQYVAGTVYRDGVAVPGQQVQGPVRYTRPLVVLVDGRSASGAEYVARDLLVRPATVVMGETTVGLANTSIQYIGLPDGLRLALSIARTVDASGLVVSAAVSPAVYGVTDLPRLVATGQDSLMEQGTRWLTGQLGR